jgi:hypothetical protein
MARPGLGWRCVLLDLSLALTGVLYGELDGHEIGNLPVHAADLNAIHLDDVWIRNRRSQLLAHRATDACGRKDALPIADKREIWH